MSESLVPLRKVRSLSDIISAVIDTIRMNIKALSLGMLRYAGPWVVVGVAFLTYYSSESVHILAGANDTESSLYNGFEEISTIFLFAAIGYIFVAIGYVATQVLIVSFLRLADNLGRQPSAEELHEEVKGKMGRAILVTFIAGLLIGLASLILLLPGLYIGVPLALLYTVIHFEGLGLRDGMSRCFVLVRNHWWWTFGVIIVIVILESLIGLVVSAPTQIISMIQLFALADGSAYDPSIVMQIILITFTALGLFGTAFLRLITSTGLVFIYSSHRERLEGASLFERIETIGQADQQQ